MSRNKPICAAAASLVVTLIISGLIIVPHATAAESSDLLGSQWFDWSDFRATVGLRVFLARLSSASLSSSQSSFDIKKDYGFTDDPEPFREFWGELYIDRLGFRFYLAEDNKFRGRVGEILEDLSTTDRVEGARVSQLEVNTSYVGADVDVVRYPFLRLGINAEFQMGQIKLQDRRDENPDLWDQVDFGQGVTVGVHGKAIPGRVRGVPITLDARARFPLPVRIDNKICKLLEVEVGAGVRPAVWNLSSYGLSTFSMGISGGYRFVSVEAEAFRKRADYTLNARWQGAFIEVAITY